MPDTGTKMLLDALGVARWVWKSRERNFRYRTIDYIFVLRALVTFIRRIDVWFHNLETNECVPTKSCLIPPATASQRY